MKNIRSVCVQGTRHHNANLLCQDSVCYAKNDSVTAIALSDGTGKDIWATIGAKTTSLSAAQYCADHFHELSTKSEDEIRYAMLSHIRSSLFHMNRCTDISVKSMGATCIVVGVDNNSGKMLFLHLGDGCVAARDQAGNVMILSYPINGVSKAYTNLITGFTCSDETRIGKGDIDGIAELLLLSDGWFEKHNRATDAAYSAFMHLDFGFEPAETKDDCSAVALQLSCGNHRADYYDSSPEN